MTSAHDHQGPRFSIDSRVTEPYYMRVNCHKFKHVVLLDTIVLQNHRGEKSVKYRPVIEDCEGVPVVILEEIE